jgi:hypothetical protein
MYSIWYFIGSLILVYGVLILGAGIVDLMSPPPQPLVLAQLHMSIWWGALMIILGALYTFLFRPRPPAHTHVRGADDLVVGEPK